MNGSNGTNGSNGVVVESPIDTNVGENVYMIIVCGYKVLLKGDKLYEKNDGVKAFRQLWFKEENLDPMPQPECEAFLVSPQIP